MIVWRGPNSPKDFPMTGAATQRPMDTRAAHFRCFVAPKVAITFTDYAL